MSTPSHRPLDVTREAILRLYYRIVLASVATVLVLQLGLRLAMGRGEAISLRLLALYAAILLLAWIGYEIVRSTTRRIPEPRGIVLGLLSLLLVVLCIETGGLSSPYYMLLFTTCLFGGLLMRGSKAFVLTFVACTAYVGLTWVYQQEEAGLLEGGLASLVRALPRARGLDPNQISALVIHSGFLFVGTFVATRLTRVYQERVSRLETHATRDPLTGLPNRRGFTEKLHLELERITQLDWPVAILIMDLDLFKHVNDRYGHPVGDLVLVEASRLLREAVGALDHLARLGGEEFGVAAVGADRTHGAYLADRIVRTFRTHDWSTIKPGLSLSCSVGVADRSPPKDGWKIGDFQNLIDQADKALLQVKTTGRNGYLVAGDEVPALPPTLGPVPPSRHVVPAGTPRTGTRIIRR
ncbi:MAG: diguanylate cyclase [Planctomycetota bacterium]